VDAQMDFSFYVILSLIAPIFLLIGIIVVKMIKNKTIPNSDYTPFDYIMGQAPIEFHEDKQEKEEKDDQGDDKNKNSRQRKYDNLPDLEHK
jgi:flagellar biosynthesis/type III secretory pathway M-ring protein FliF/YscJ